MAIKRIDPNAKFKIISEFDDAVLSETPEELEQLKKENKPTRYEEYIENLDETKLKFKENAKFDRFVIRCLKNAEIAEIQERHIVVDVVNKKVTPKNTSTMFLDHFNLACEGIENPDGSVTRVTSDDVGFAVAVGIGSAISLFTSLGKHLKK